MLYVIQLYSSKITLIPFLSQIKKDYLNPLFLKLNEKCFIFFLFSHASLKVGQIVIFASNRHPPNVNNVGGINNTSTTFSAYGARFYIQLLDFSFFIPFHILVCLYLHNVVLSKFAVYYMVIVTKVEHLTMHFSINTDQAVFFLIILLIFQASILLFQLQPHSTTTVQNQTV